MRSLWHRPFHMFFWSFKATHRAEFEERLFRELWEFATQCHVYLCPDPGWSEQYSKVMAHAEFYIRSQVKSSVLFGSHTVRPWALWVNKSQRSSRSTLKHRCHVSQTEATDVRLPSVHASCSVYAGLAPGIGPDWWIELITDLCTIIIQPACEGCDLSF